MHLFGLGQSCAWLSRLMRSSLHSKQSNHITFALFDRNEIVQQRVICLLFVCCAVALLRASCASCISAEHFHLASMGGGRGQNFVSPVRAGVLTTLREKLKGMILRSPLRRAIASAGQWARALVWMLPTGGHR